MTNATHLAEQAAILLGQIQHDTATLQAIGAELLPHLVEPETLTADAVAAWLLDPTRTDEEIEATAGKWLDKITAELDGDDVDPPAVPAEPVNPAVPFEAVQTVTLDPTHSSYDQGKALSKILVPGTRIVVPAGVSCSILKLGGGNHATRMADGSPIRDIEIRGTDEGSALNGLELHPDIEGTVRIRDLTLRPSSEFDKAAVRSIGMCYGTVLDMAEIDFEPLPGATGFHGFGMMWNITFQGGHLVMRDIEFCAAQEWGLYAHSTGGVLVENFRNSTKVVDGMTLGMGRGLVKHENRASGMETITGFPSTGNVVFRNGVATRCGHEGLLQGNLPSGGSDYTVGGHTGDRVIFENLTSINPYCGGIAVWQEADPTNRSTPENPAGVKCWQVHSDGSVWHPDEGYGHSVRRFDLEGYRVQRTDVPKGRTPILLSGIQSGSVHDIGTLHCEVDHQKHLPGQSTIPDCGLEMLS